MRKLYYTLIIVLFLAACDKDSNDDKQQAFQAKGTLTGIDPSMCACCGGVLLTINGDPKIYKIQRLANMTWDQMYHLQFPKQIEFNFTNPSFTCGVGELLEIDDYILH